MVANRECWCLRLCRVEPTCLTGHRNAAPRRQPLARGRAGADRATWANQRWCDRPEEVRDVAHREPGRKPADPRLLEVVRTPGEPPRSASSRSRPAPAPRAGRPHRRGLARPLRLESRPAPRPADGAADRVPKPIASTSARRRACGVHATHFGKPGSPTRTHRVRRRRDRPASGPAHHRGPQDAAPRSPMMTCASSSVAHLAVARQDGQTPIGPHCHSSWPPPHPPSRTRRHSTVGPAGCGLQFAGAARRASRIVV